ncbi:hypothetical protein AMES_7190 [Amycolatopsis mediterranei S699]|uniref:Uncharacterized protein n=3 Tax=Amycolatopsis mediterranei TaxID=33910 RepID=A0A0H3DFN5_AMYMU|nr:hypothetical protein AMED_7301 [Amycolatopsis mediterranei U32]AFO80723.1 hypothetical protein AMES_7190 [Amycolatopsis mediterranei S699]AGT87851.1 hypothetical protein B737_7190 [Amycolatopsis mediterranei RB]KDU93864.1 hypothetical protein DV36_00560 [Amycolatopsis mediterranei]
MFGRMPGRDGGYLPGGPYTVTQGTLFLVLVVVVWKLPLLDWLGPARWGLPLSAVFLRRARIEARTPLSWLAGLAAHLLAPQAGMLGRRPFRPAWSERSRGWLYVHLADEVEEPAVPVSSLQQVLAQARER